MEHSSYCCQFISVVQCILACAGGGGGTVNYISNVVTPKVPALFTFGDSIADPGNNNFIPTMVKADFPPHGRDFIDSKPTGRFSNGKLSTDFVAAELGLKERVPAFLDPQLESQDFLTGVSFASAGSGFDNLTAEASSVIPMWKQLQYFQDYKLLLAEMVGEANSSTIIRDAIFLIVAGTNDFIGNYDRLPLRKKQFTVAEYEDFIVEICSNFIEELYRLGGRKFGVYGIPPPGCLPLIKTLYGQPKVEGCIEELNQVAISYNAKLKKSLGRLEARFLDIKVVYIDIYESFLDIVNNPTKYGFDISSRGCCGTGLTEFGPTCNESTPNTCWDASKYVFWDALHSTQTTYEITAKDVLDRYILKML